MPTATLIESLQSRGFAVQADGEKLIVSPSSALTDDDRQAIRDHKAELLALLHSEPDAENVETHDSALLAGSETQRLIEQLQAAGCRFTVADGKPRLFYPPDMDAELVQRVAALVAGRDEASREFRRLARQVAADTSGAELCPICCGAVQEQRGKHFRHLWCPQPGHFDAWRAMAVLKLKETGAPIVQGRGQVSR